MLSGAGEVTALAAEALFLGLMAAVVWIDARRMIIPDGLNAAILAIGIAAVLLTGFPSPLMAALGAAVGGAAMALVRLAVSRRVGREAMGLGDVKFVTAAGVWVGLAALPAMLVVASLTGLAVALLRRRRHGASPEMPFGPFLAVGAVAARGMEMAGWLG
ncbi:prepilin peptidase [Alsobacter sp. R-9]